MRPPTSAGRSCNQGKGDVRGNMETTATNAGGRDMGVVRRGEAKGAIREQGSTSDK